ncbi:hypothetical protein BDC45DRAFT_526832 [Circinella umbellata]|nr:hypothetical protein BDC45DRAFT_526832 [Circinella umbellata]
MALFKKSQFHVYVLFLFYLIASLFSSLFLFHICVHIVCFFFFLLPTGWFLFKFFFSFIFSIKIIQTA